MSVRSLLQIWYSNFSVKVFIFLLLAPMNSKGASVLLFESFFISCLWILSKFRFFMTLRGALLWCYSTSDFLSNHIDKAERGNLLGFVGELELCKEKQPEWIVATAEKIYGFCTRFLMLFIVWCSTVDISAGAATEIWFQIRFLD